MFLVNNYSWIINYAGTNKIDLFLYKQNNLGYYSTAFKNRRIKMRKINNPVAKFSARLNYNAGVHEKSNKAKRKSNKQKFMNAFRKGKENYFMSQFA